MIRAGHWELAAWPTFCAKSLLDGLAVAVVLLTAAMVVDAVGAAGLSGEGKDWVGHMIYIIRHGQTELNNANVLQGRSDCPLNEKGIAQAREAGQWLKDQGIVFSYVYSSPLKRAVRTAEIIAPEKPVVIDDRLIEMDYGPYEGMDLKNPAPEITTFFSDFVNNPAPEGMEPLSKVVQRAGAFLEDIKDLQGNILVSTHAIAMKGVLEYLTPGSNGSYWSKYVGNCAVYAANNVNGKIDVPEEVKASQIHSKRK